MDEWRLHQQQRMVSGGVGPVLSYHPIRSRSSPYPLPQQMSELKQSYQYQPNPSTTSSNPLSPSMSATTPNPTQISAPLSVKNDSSDASSSSTDEVSTATSNSDVYIPSNTNGTFAPVPTMEQRMMSNKSSIGPMVGYHPGQQQMAVARSRAQPYPMPPPGHHHHSHSMYSHPSGPVCQCAQHMHPNSGHYPMHPSQHPMYYHHQQQQQQQQQQHQQQQHEAWYRYQQQQQAAWRQHQMQQHLQSHSQPMPIEQSYNAILSDTSSTTKLKATKLKSKKKSSNAPLLNEEPLMKYQPVPPVSLNLPVQHQPQSRACIPPPSTAYYPSIYSTPNPYVQAQQLPPPPSTSIPQDHPMYTQTSPSTLSHHQSQIFTSPLSNPGTPHQILTNGEYINGTAEFGVPYHHGAPGSVNSLTDALCPSGGDTTDRQMTPGPPSVGTPRVAPHQYSFPQTPSTPQMINQNTNPHTPVMMPPTPNPLSAPPTPLTRPRSSSEQIPNHFQQYEPNKAMSNVDDLAAYLKDPTNIYLTDDVSSTLFDDIDALANTYLGPQSNNPHEGTVDGNSADDILLNFLCSDLTN